MVWCGVSGAMTSPGMAIRFGRAGISPKAGGMSPFSPLQSKSLNFGGRIKDGEMAGPSSLTGAAAAGGKRKARKHEPKHIRSDADGHGAGGNNKPVSAGDLQPGWAPVRRTTDDHTLQPIDKSQVEQREKLIAAEPTASAQPAAGNKNYDSLSSSVSVDVAAVCDLSALDDEVRCG